MMKIVRNKETQKKFLVITYGKIFKSDVKVVMFKEISLADAEVQVLSLDKFNSAFEDVKE